MLKWNYLIASICGSLPLLYAVATTVVNDLLSTVFSSLPVVNVIIGVDKRHCPLSSKCGSLPGCVTATIVIAFVCCCFCCCCCCGRRTFLYYMCLSSSYFYCYCLLFLLFLLWTPIFPPLYMVLFQGLICFFCCYCWWSQYWPLSTVSVSHLVVVLIILIVKTALLSFFYTFFFHMLLLLSFYAVVAFAVVDITISSTGFFFFEVLLLFLLLIYAGVFNTDPFTYMWFLPLVSASPADVVGAAVVDADLFLLFEVLFQL